MRVGYASKVDVHISERHVRLVPKADVLPIPDATNALPKGLMKIAPLSHPAATTTPPGLQEACDTRLSNISRQFCGMNLMQEYAVLHRH